MVILVKQLWNGVIEHFLFLPYGSLAIPEQYEAVCNFILRRSKNFDSREEVMNSKESGILEYLTGLVDGQLHQFWKIPPALAAAAIPFWCCNCSQVMREHKTCELAERIWCLYIFHAWGSQLLHGPTTAL